MKCIYTIFILLATALIGCSDYQQMLEDDYGSINWAAPGGEISFHPGITDPNEDPVIDNPVSELPIPSAPNVGTFIEERDGATYGFTIIGNQAAYDYDDKGNYLSIRCIKH